MDTNKHLVWYDHAEEELLDLEKEKIEWVDESAKKKLKQLWWGSLDSKGGYRRISLGVAEPSLFDCRGGSPPPNWLDGHPPDGQGGGYGHPQNVYFYFEKI